MEYDDNALTDAIPPEAHSTAVPAAATGETQAQGQPSTRDTFRLYSGFLLSIMAVAVCYYFLFALPSYHRARLELERARQQAVTHQQEEKDRKAALAEEERRQERQTQDLLYSSCCDEAEKRYWSYIELNGEKVPGKPGVYSAPRSVWDQAEEEKQSALDECARRYRH